VHGRRRRKGRRALRAGRLREGSTDVSVFRHPDRGSKRTWRECVSAEDVSVPLEPEAAAAADERPVERFSLGKQCLHPCEIGRSVAGEQRDALGQIGLHPAWYARLALTDDLVDRPHCDERGDAEIEFGSWRAGCAAYVVNISWDGAAAEQCGPVPRERALGPLRSVVQTLLEDQDQPAQVLRRRVERGAGSGRACCSIYCAKRRTARAR
jgi:hypothetical protein